jgi:dimethylhistidine N-methyltransferase
LGAGNCAKGEALFEWLKPAAYVAMDISLGHLKPHLTALHSRHPQLPKLGWGLDFSKQFNLDAGIQDWLTRHQLEEHPWVVFYPGSSIGNFSPTDALNLLERIRGATQDQKGGGLLIGVDNVKPVAVLESAYNDALGVTAAFNRNLLLHVNRLIGSDFDLDGWAHFAKFDVAHARIEMHLESLVPQTVHWTGGSRHFLKHERIHTENSYKWTPEAFVGLLQSAGFSAPTRWTDPQHWFNVYWAPC